MFCTPCDPNNDCQNVLFLSMYSASRKRKLCASIIQVKLGMTVETLQRCPLYFATVQPLTVLSLYSVFLFCFYIFCFIYAHFIILLCILSLLFLVCLLLLNLLFIFVIYLFLIELPSQSFFAQLHLYIQRDHKHLQSRIFSTGMT